MEDVNGPRRRRHSSRVTINDVAHEAGVAPITVSRALNQPDTVSAALRERITEAVDSLGYVPNRVAGSLASASTRVVPVIVPSLSNAVFIEVVDGIQAVLEHHGYQILLGNTEYDLDREADLVQTLLGWAPAGAVIAGLRHHDRTRELLRRWGRPLVEIMECGEPAIDMNVGLSHYDAGAAMAKHLLERGYRRIGFVGARPQQDYRAEQRLTGFRRVLDEAGIGLNFVLTYEEPTAIALGARAFAEIEQQRPDAEAVFFANDDLAVGAILEAQRRRIPIPERLAIAGFNGLSLGEQVTPRLTTIVSPRYQMGRVAADMLIARLEGKEIPARQVNVGFELAVREST